METVRTCETTRLHGAISQKTVIFKNAKEFRYSKASFSVLHTALLSTFVYRTIYNTSTDAYGGDELRLPGCSIIAERHH
jgi:hypothetical protein